MRDVRVIALMREDGSKYLAAYLLPGEGYREAELREYLSANLPEFMVPPWLVVMSHFPLTPNGKLDRAQLPNPLKRARPQSGYCRKQKVSGNSRQFGVRCWGWTALASMTVSLVWGAIRSPL